METIRVYRSINDQDHFLGLEPTDWLLLIAVFLVEFTANGDGVLLNLLTLSLIYAGLRAVKRGKPAGYILVLARHALVNPYRRVLSPQECDALEPYSPR